MKCVGNNSESEGSAGLTETSQKWFAIFRKSILNIIFCLLFIQLFTFQSESKHVISRNSLFWVAVIFQVQTIYNNIVWTHYTSRWFQKIQQRVRVIKYNIMRIKSLIPKVENKFSSSANHKTSASLSEDLDYNSNRVEFVLVSARRLLIAGEDRWNLEAEIMEILQHLEADPRTRLPPHI